MNGIRDIPNDVLADYIARKYSLTEILELPVNRKRVITYHGLFYIINFSLCDQSINSEMIDENSIDFIISYTIGGLNEFKLRFTAYTPTKVEYDIDGYLDFACPTEHLNVDSAYESFICFYYDPSKDEIARMYTRSANAHYGN